MNSKPDIEKIVSRESFSSFPTNGNFLNRLSWTKDISDQEKAKFCLELSVMLQARVSLHRSLEILAEQNPNENVKQIISDLLREVQKGNSFSSALNKFPLIFDNLFTVTAEVGQESGRLPQVMLNLATYLEKIGMLKRKLKQAMVYPVLVLSVAVVAVLFLLLFIVPTFAEMFRSLQVELPFSTQLILSVSDWLLVYGIWVILGMIGLFLFFKTMLQSAKTNEQIEMLLNRVPLIGRIISKTFVARFCRTLGTLLQSQVSLVNALEITQRIFTAKNIRDEIQHITYHVRQGKSVAEPMIQSKVFPPMVAQMIAVGEETSELDSMLMKVADYYEKEIDSTVETLSNIIEPVLILFLGIIVAAVLISMYMPMFELMNVIN